MASSQPDEADTLPLRSDLPGGTSITLSDAPISEPRILKNSKSNKSHIDQSEPPSDFALNYEPVDLLPSQSVESVRSFRLMKRNEKRLKLLTGVLVGLVVLLLLIMILISIRKTGCDGGTNILFEGSGGSPLFDESISKKFASKASRIIKAAKGRATPLYEKLKKFCYTFGPRFSGSENLEKAIEWVKGELESDGFEEVHLQPVEGVSHWLRGEEVLEMLKPRVMKLNMIGLGGSVSGNVVGKLICVSSFEDLASKGSEVDGKIVLFNVPFVNYGETVAYRVRGASEASKYGAVAALVRSISPFSMGNPHTGALFYEGNFTKIPAAAISLEHADMLHYLVTSGEFVALHLKMSGQNGDQANSFNVIGQITGSQHPNEIITVGGHIDSWDVGLGAMDDAGGMLVTWEAVKLLFSLNLRPKRTIRFVAFTNEEEGGLNGVLGGQVYADSRKNETHILGIESDSGTFSPEGFYFLGSDPALDILSRISGTLLGKLNATVLVNSTWAGTDVEPLNSAYGTPVLELKTDASRYFWYHHSAADAPDKLDPKELTQCAATIAIMAYVVADMENSLPK